MASKPVKVLTDLLTKKQIIKRDLNDNILFNVSGTINGGHVSSSLPITGSSAFLDILNTTAKSPFEIINVFTSSTGVYNVDNAFHALDTKLNNTIIDYKRLRYQITGNFDFEGYAEVMLPKEQYGKYAFPAQSIDFIDISVMIRDGNSWTNDLIGISLIQSGAMDDEIWVQISAPALNETNKFRLLATNEDIGLLGV